MTPITMKRPQILDKEAVFRMYITDMGSARSIRKVSRQLGASAINPNTGRPVSDMAIWWSIWRFAAENFELSYSIANDAARNEGLFFTREYWRDTVNKKVSLIVKHSEKRMKKWQKLMPSDLMTSV